MDNAGYVTLARQSGLQRQLNTIANNIANISTVGYRRESAIFSEHVKSMKGGDPSMSIATMNHRYVDFSEGQIRASANPLDVAIEGDGFFLVETAEGPRLTRAGAFSLNGAGQIVDIGKRRVLTEAGGPIVVPPNTRSISIATDGSVSADGEIVGRLGVVTAEVEMLEREGDNLFRVIEDDYRPAQGVMVRQNALESSNVSAVRELALLIEVQRAYEQGQKFTQDEDDRIRRVVRELGQPG